MHIHISLHCFQPVSTWDAASLLLPSHCTPPPLPSPLQVFIDEHHRFETKTWKDVCVGDIIIVHKDEYFPADLVFLSSEHADGLCYIETMQLDGETNLKIKKALDQTKDLREGSLGAFRGEVVCEPPNSNLYKFTGNLELRPPLADTPTVLPLSPACMLMRGCSLRNTPRIFGLVVFTGTGCFEGCGDGWRWGAGCSELLTSC